MNLFFDTRARFRLLAIFVLFFLEMACLTLFIYCFNAEEMAAQQRRDTLARAVDSEIAR